MQLANCLPPFFWFGRAGFEKEDWRDRPNSPGNCLLNFYGFCVSVGRGLPPEPVPSVLLMGALALGIVPLGNNCDSSWSIRLMAAFAFLVQVTACVTLCCVTQLHGIIFITPSWEQVHLLCLTTESSFSIVRTSQVVIHWEVSHTMLYRGENMFVPWFAGYWLPLHSAKPVTIGHRL